MPLIKAPSRTRPKDRKLQIVAAAQKRFAEAGYAQVSMAQIAEDVGISAGALYRHFTNKSVLLIAVIEDSLDRAIPLFDRHETLSEAVEYACRYVAEHPEAGALWWRELNHVPLELRGDLRARLWGINRRCASLVLDMRPELSEAAATLLAWGIHAILVSTSWYSTKMDPSARAAFLKESCLAVATLPVPEGGKVEASTEALTPVAKRERLLVHAIALFDEKGFAATLDEIGGAAGVTGPSLYGHFACKNEILQAAIDRSTNALWLLLHDVLRHAKGPDGALEGLVRGYVRLALDKATLTAVLQTEHVGLSAADRARHREYIAEWRALLRAARPTLTESQARVSIHTALAVVHTLSRIDDLGESIDLNAAIAAMSVAVLLDSRTWTTGSEQRFPSK
ncbi:TetR/AcrR family transcriptional regulator [Rhodococcus pyridinivorans]|uniref:TetR/AcrR family transcriptional regulator n=1 Tax=Rhodococcus pyridinivorans TaxID=103816 RepID=UPI001E291688|nr:TetR/AcrR family transcriptional regulator [Rhodococcus pyridinivorans]MCD5422456.1 TetR/AcrR family transcriptional regulator [Rhodococcus pyridinivorans]